MVEKLWEKSEKSQCPKFTNRYTPGMLLKNLLNKLKNELDPKEKNKIIDKLENILSNALKNYNPEISSQEK